MSDGLFAVVHICSAASLRVFVSFTFSLLSVREEFKLMFSLIIKISSKMFVNARFHTAASHTEIFKLTRAPMDG